MKNMNEFLTSIANGTLTDDAIAFAKSELEKRATANANAASKRNDKWYAENGELLEAVRALLISKGHPLTASEIVANVEGINSTSKATAICKRIEGIVIGEAQADKRIVKVYSL